MRAAILCAFILVAGAGCVTEAGDTSPAATTPPAAGTGRPVVIALLDGGTNPYLEVFRTSDPVVLRPDATEVQLALDGDFFEDDQAAWMAIRPGQLYHFTGTRLYAIGMDETPSAYYPIITQQHGARTSYLAARDAPDAIIVMVQVDGSLCASGPTCVIDPSVAEGMEWIAEQDWIDVVSVSIAFPGNAPGLPPDASRFVAASERAASSGKVIVNGGGNEAIPPVTGFTNGLPWVICVGGFEPSARGESIYSAKTSDVIANYTEVVPQDWNGTLGSAHGTSFATPVVAATLANVIEEVWRADPSRVAVDLPLRAALNSSARLVQPTEWQPDPGDALDMGVPVLLPGQIGWGYVDASLAPEIARRILEGDLDPPPEKQQIALFQAQWQAAREAYWGIAR